MHVRNLSLRHCLLPEDVADLVGIQQVLGTVLFPSLLSISVSTWWAGEFADILLPGLLGSAVDGIDLYHSQFDLQNPRYGWEMKIYWTQFRYPAGF
jgi:hypothetical protein